MQRNRAYRFIFWGFLLMIVHLNLGQLQILPNFIAAMIIVRGLSILLEDTQNRYILLSRRLCSLYVVTQVGAFLIEITKQSSFFRDMSSSLNEALTILALGVNSTLMITVVFYLFIGSEMLLTERNGQCFPEYSQVDSLEPVKSISKVAINFAILYTIATLLMIVGLVFRSEMGALAIISMLAYLVATLMVIFNVAYLRRQYPEF